MIAEQANCMTSEEIYNSFAETFGDRPFIDRIQDQGDLINQDAPSTIVDGVLIRNKNQYLIEEVKIEMLIKDGEAARSQEDLEKYFFTPAAEWLREQLGDRQVVAICDVPASASEGIATYNVKGLQMLSKYDGLGHGTKLTFRVFAATAT